ncbi:gag-like protein [Beauveria brongniartii RCEF 3172]|uniref:Gag-like protein n=1 Tax=Beauveria brongniartii RCEF 3172 TaxID=1081107 RepID=A0A167FEI8_9HYPO|nr:gag-like protein [Beauveria brongniartii RCEF 3172]
MAPKWPQVNNGPEHINEHATYLREACNQLQAVDRGRHNQVPWNIVQPYLESTILLTGKVLRQPALREILQQVKDAAKCTQNIQNDVTIIKNSVGLSTTPLNASNFSGTRTRGAPMSWAQVAAQGRGSLPLPPPVSHDTTANKDQTTVTAYKDRTVTVKLKDNGIIQRHRTRPASWTKQQVETAVRTSSATTSIKIVAAHQLKSGDIQIIANTTAEAKRLKENQEWIRSLGENAELIVPTYGVIVHGIPTNSLNIKDQGTTIQQMLADNHTVIPSARISYIGWLTKEAHLKRASSIVVEFIEPEMANAIIYAGMQRQQEQQEPCPRPDINLGLKPGSSPSNRPALSERPNADSVGRRLTASSAGATNTAGHRNWDRVRTIHGTNSTEPIRGGYLDESRACDRMYRTSKECSVSQHKKQTTGSNEST